MGLIFRDLGAALAGALAGSMQPQQPGQRRRQPEGCTPCQARGMAADAARAAQQAYKHPGAPLPFAPRRGR